MLAVLVHNALAGGAVFRTIFLFPYALSFIVTGVVWRWIFTPSAGANLILQALGMKPNPGGSPTPPSRVTSPTL